jgi:hypothetical protein
MFLNGLYPSSVDAATAISAAATLNVVSFRFTLTLGFLGLARSTFEEESLPACRLMVMRDGSGVVPRTGEKRPPPLPPQPLPRLRPPGDRMCSSDWLLLRASGT